MTASRSGCASVLSSRWSADVSYLYSYLRGNWSGLASSDEAVGGLQLNSGRAFNLLYYSYDAQGNPTYGRLGTDRPHQFKVQGTYDLPWGTMVGVNAIVGSGVPLSTVMTEKNMTFFPYGRGDLGRAPTFSQLDLMLQQEFRLPGNMRVMFGVNASNLFDQKTEDRPSRRRRTAISSTSPIRCSLADSIRRRWRPRRISARMLASAWPAASRIRA